MRHDEGHFVLCAKGAQGWFRLDPGATRIRPTTTTVSEADVLCSAQTSHAVYLRTQVTKIGMDVESSRSPDPRTVVSVGSTEVEDDFSHLTEKGLSADIERFLGGEHSKVWTSAAEAMEAHTQQKQDSLSSIDPLVSPPPDKFIAQDDSKEPVYISNFARRSPNRKMPDSAAGDTHRRGCSSGVSSGPVAAVVSRDLSSDLSAGIDSTLQKKQHEQRILGSGPKFNQQQRGGFRQHW